jgi:hypothetical protein
VVAEVNPQALRRPAASAYLAVSGAGLAGVDELEGQVASVGAASAALVRGGAALAFPAGAKWPVPIAYNVVSFNYRLVEHAMGGLADAIQPHHGAPDSVNPFGRGMPDYYQSAGRR